MHGFNSGDVLANANVCRDAEVDDKQAARTLEGAIGNHRLRGSKRGEDDICPLESGGYVLQRTALGGIRFGKSLCGLCRSAQNPKARRLKDSKFFYEALGNLTRPED
jgi:hypothetical protein